MDLCSIDWLPEPAVVMARSKAAAAADALLSPDADLRQYGCKANWQPGITAAWRHDGAGTYYYILQEGDTVAIKVCALRASMAPDALCRFQNQPTVEMPALAVRLINEPEFRYQELSFLAWSTGGAPWQGLLFRVDNTTSLEMGRGPLELVCVGPKTFYLYAQSYHEVTVDPPTLKAIFSLAPLDKTMVKTFAPEADFGSCGRDLAAIGYPMA
jgi:hypothetical protein